MIPKTLTVSGFLSYRAPVEIDFTSFDLACISGSNGSGKSSLLDAITWVLFGQARKRDESLINMQSDFAQVTLEFEYESNNYLVQRTNPRGKATMLEFQILTPDGTWKPLTERTQRDTQARLEQTLKLDYETFINAAFFIQGKADQFTQQTPSNRKRILGSILGLDVWETYRRGAWDRRRTVETEISTLDGRMNEIKGELAEEDERKERLAELETQLDQLTNMRVSMETNLENIRKILATLEEQEKMVNTIARQLADTSQRLEELRHRLEIRVQEKEEYRQSIARASEIQTAYQEWQSAREQLSAWEEIATRFNEHEKRRHGPLMEIESERARLEAEKESLLSQEAKLQDLLTESQELQFALSQTQTDLEVLENQLSIREEINSELQSALNRLADAKAENPRLRESMNVLKDRISQLSETEGATCPLCGQSLTPNDRLRLIDELTAEGKVMGDRYRDNLTVLREADEGVNDLKNRINEFKYVEKDYQTKRTSITQLETQLDQIKAQENEWQETNAPRLTEIQEALSAGLFATEARAALAATDAELKKIGYDASAHDQTRQAEAEGRAIEEQIRDLERAQAALGPLDREISELNTEVDSLIVVLDQQQAEYDEAAAALATAQVNAPDIEKAQHDLLEAQERENRVRMSVGMARQQVDVLEDLKERQKFLQKEKESLTLQVALYRQVERAFGKDGVPALLIEQALPQLETKANDILDRLSSGEMHIRFETQRELKTRQDLRETLDIQISDTAGVRDYEMYSGGEAFRVNFAIRLALSEILAQRAGARLQTLVIDEGFGSQDEIGRQRLIEAINLVRDDFAKILVITHIDSLKEAFPTRIEVEKSGLGSVARVI